MSDRYRDNYAGKSRSGTDRRGPGRYEPPRHTGPPRGEYNDFEPHAQMERSFGYDRGDSGRYVREPEGLRGAYPDIRSGRREERFENEMFPPQPPHLRDYPDRFPPQPHGRDFPDRGFPPQPPPLRDYPDREPPRTFIDHRHREFPPEGMRHGRDAPPPPREPFSGRRRGRSGSNERRRRRTRSRSRERGFPDSKREPFSGRDPAPPREGSEIVENSIFISNLPADVNVNELASLFGSIGVIQVDKRSGLFKIKIYYNPDGSCKGEASIYYQDSQAARAAIQWFNHSDLRGKKMTVQMTDRSYSTTRPSQKGGNFRGPPRGSGDNERGGKGSGNKPSFAQPGDWTCTSCKNTNFAWRTACNRCQAEKPAGEGAPPDQGRDFQGGYKRSPPRGGNPRGGSSRGRHFG